MFKYVMYGDFHVPGYARTGIDDQHNIDIMEGKDTSSRAQDTLREEVEIQIQRLCLPSVRVCISVLHLAADGDVFVFHLLLFPYSDFLPTPPDCINIHVVDYFRSTRVRAATKMSCLPLLILLVGQVFLCCWCIDLDGFCARRTVRGSKHTPQSCWH